MLKGYTQEEFDLEYLQDNSFIKSIENKNN